MFVPAPRLPGKGSAIRAAHMGYTSVPPGQDSLRGAHTVRCSQSHSARTVPVQCPYSARCSARTVPDVVFAIHRAKTCTRSSRSINTCSYQEIIIAGAHVKTFCVIYTSGTVRALHRALYGHCTGTVRALYSRCNLLSRPYIVSTCDALFKPRRMARRSGPQSRVSIYL